MAVVRTLTCLAVLALAATESSLAAPKSPDAAMMAPINAVAEGLNGGKTLTAAPFSNDAVIVDEFPPFVWRGAGSGEAWLNSFGTFSKQMNITEPHVTLHVVKYFESTSSAAYIVVPTLFSCNINGKPLRENGLWTFALTKRGSKWLIASESWSKQSESM